MGKFLDSQTVTIPANGVKEHRLSFLPDQVFIASPSYSCELGINIRLEGQTGSAPQPLIGQGPVQLPGVSANQLIYFESLESTDVDLLVIAQAGYPSVNVNMPTALASSPTFGWENISGSALLGTGGTSHNLTIPTILSDDVIVLVGTSGAADRYNSPTVTDITLGGGASLTEQVGVTAINDAEAANRTYAGIWSGVSGGTGSNIACAITTAANTYGLAVVIISFANAPTPGIGNAVDWYAAVPESAGVSTVDSEAYAFMACAMNGNQDYTENSGAVFIDDEKATYGTFAFYYKNGSGILSFTVDPDAGIKNSMALLPAEPPG